MYTIGGVSHLEELSSALAIDLGGELRWLLEEFSNLWASRYLARILIFDLAKELRPTVDK